MKARGLKMLNPFADSYPSKSGGFVFLQLGGNDLQNAFADDLLRGIPEHAFSRGVPAGNDSLHVGADNAVLGRLYNGLKEKGCLLSLIRKQGVPMFLRGVSGFLNGFGLSCLF